MEAQVDWRAKASELAELALRRAEGTADLKTAADVFEELRRVGCQVKADGDALVIAPRPPESLRQAIRDRKPELLILARPMPPQGCRREDGSFDWKQEWDSERDLLLRRACATNNPDLKAELLRMAEMQIANAETWQGSWFLVAGLEERLRMAGTLPRAVWNE